MRPFDPTDLLVDRLVAELGDRYIVEFREYPRLGAALTQYLFRLSENPQISQALGQLDAIAGEIKILAPNVNFAKASADELDAFVAAEASFNLQVEFFLTDSIPFATRRALFFVALVAHDMGLININVTPGAQSDIALRFVPATFLSLSPQLPKPIRTAALCLAAEYLS
jgi:hypothetical protein